MKSFAYLPETSRAEDTPKRGWSAPSITLFILVVVFIVSVIVRLIQQDIPLQWLFGPNGSAGGKLPEDIGKALAPILALALAIERLIETVFDFFETKVKEVAKNTTGAADSLNYIEEMRVLYTKQMNLAKEKLQDAIANNKPQEDQDAAVSAVKKAEELVLEAGSKLENLAKDPVYVSWKRGLSIWLGLVMGMVVAVFIDKGVFFFLNFDVPRIFDMLLTGFILGAGSGPLHSLIGILQGAKDALSSFSAASLLGINKPNRGVNER